MIRKSKFYNFILNTIPAFIFQVKQEIYKVIWPTRKEALFTSLTVLILSFVLIVFFLIIDGIISFGINKIIVFINV